MVAGRGEATASSPGTPRTASTGVAIDEPPTPNNPVSVPIAIPATTKTGHGATSEHRSGLIRISAAIEAEREMTKGEPTLRWMCADAPVTRVTE
jgi:hypothetical protein